MANQLTVIENKLTTPEVRKEIALRLNLDPNDEAAQNKAKKYAMSVLAEIAKTQGDPKKDLTVCSPDSIVQTMIDAAQFQLSIDGRQHAHIVKYGQNATLQIGYRGYLAKVKEIYPDADFTIRPIYEGEKVKIIDDGGSQTYTVSGDVDPFDVDESKLKGVLVAVSYTDNGRLIRKVNAVPKSRIDRAKRAAKQDFIWKSDYIEKAKAAAIKASFKVMFASIQGLQDVANYDNQKNYDPNQEASSSRSSIIENINQSVGVEPGPDPEPEEDFEPEIIDAEIIEQVNIDNLVMAGDKASNQGLDSYKAWAATLTEKEKEPLREHHAEWVRKAKEVDSEESIDW